MGATKYLVPTFSLAAVALAGCSAPTTTLETGGDAAAIAACQTYTGDIVVNTGAVVDNKLDLDGVEKIDGKLTYMNDANVQTISASKLSEITGDLTLSNLTQLSTIDFGNLDTASNIKFTGLGSLGSLGFGNPGLSEAGNVTIDNTQITSLEGLQNATKLAGIDITNNPTLNEISFSVDKIATILIGPNDVSGEGGVKFSASNLTSADTVVIRNCSDVEIPKLEEVTAILALIGNTYESFKAPELAWVGGLVMDDNTALKNMSFPALMAVNGSNSTLEVANNTKLSSITGFSALKIVNGGVNLFGAFSSVTFPKITRIGGALTVDTSSQQFDCDKLPKTGQGIVRGNVHCVTADKTPEEGGSGTGSGSSSTSSSFAYPQEIPSTFMPIFGIIAGLLFA